MLLIKIAILFLITKNDAVVYVPCMIGNANKCLAIYSDTVQNGLPKPDARLINETWQLNNTICFDMCAEDVKCLMAAYRSENSSCLMYENISYLDVVDHTYLLFFWRCCNPNTSYPAPGRCPGFWKYKSNVGSLNTMRINDPIVSIDNANLENCLWMCLKNPICGAINVKTSTKTAQIACELIIAFPVEKMDKETRWDWYTLIWQCAANYTLPTPDKNCVMRPNDNPGFFDIQNSSIKMEGNIKTIMFFHTFNYNACLQNCLKYKGCKRAWFSLSSMFCMLEAEEWSTCADYQALNTYSFTTYIWVSCPVYQDKVLTQILYENNQCYKIINNEHMYIYHTKCGHLPRNINKVYSCAIPIKFGDPPVYHPNLHCLKNQSFQIVNKLNEPIPELGIFANLNWIRVFSGYETFWLANTSDVTFQAVDDFECEIYNANKEPSDNSALKIISRNEWFAKKPKGPQMPFPPFPVPYVIITDTERPFCNCYSIEACSYQIRLIEDSIPGFIAIPYNFIITGDGVVYKSKGWEFINKAMGAAYNSRSISIALCGRYLNKRPNVVTLNSIKKLIQLSIDKGKVAKNYTLYLLRDIGIHNLPYQGLVNVISLWPHYRNHLKLECSMIGSYIIVICLLMTMFLVTLVLYVYHIYVERIQHNKFCATVKMCRIQKMYAKMWKKSKEFFPQIFLHHFDHLKKENVEISPFTSSLFWIENRQKVGGKITSGPQCQCQSAVFSVFNYCQLQTSLVNISCIASMTELRLCSKIISFIFQRNPDIDTEIIIILHCTNLASFKQFVHKLYKNQCLCTFYTMTKFEPDSRLFLVDHNCFEKPRYTKTKTPIIRSQMEDLYCFLRDESNCLQYYRQLSEK